MKDREIDFARLTAQTDKMSVKSAYDVRLEIITKEKDVLIGEIESYKDQMARLGDEVQLLKVQQETDPEKEALRQQIISLEADQESKQKLREENQALYEKTQTLNAKINLLVTENHNLREGQLEAIAAAEKSRTAPSMFFQQTQAENDKEAQIQVFPA